MVQVDPVTGLLSVSYAEIVPVVIEAFKQHVSEYGKEKEEVANQLDELRGKIEALERGIRILSIIEI